MLGRKNTLDDESLLIYGIYNKLINNEKHYTVLQVKYRSLATYWLLIIFSSMGVIFSSSETGFPFDRLLATIVISSVGIVGISFIWYEDLVVQERFLNLNHLEAFRLENKYAWLPKIHHQYVVYTHKVMIKLKVMFYVGCNLILFAVMNLSLVMHLIKLNYFLLYALVPIGVLSFFFLSKFMFLKTYKNELNALKESLHARR